MSPTTKAYLAASEKTAVHAVLTNTGLIAMMHSNFYLSGNWKGLEHIGLATIAVIISSQTIFWAPRLMKWASSPTPGVDS